MTVRPEPVPNATSREYWTGGAVGELRITRCVPCRRWQHPPLPCCPDCGGDVQAEAVSGAGTVHSFTVNRYRWAPGIEPPYVLAEVELAEQAGLRVLSTVLDCAEPRVGLPVTVSFEQAGASWVPVFRPAAATYAGPA